MLINKFKLLISPTIEPGNFGGKTDNPIYSPCRYNSKNKKQFLSNLKMVLGNGKVYFPPNEILSLTTF